MFFNLAPLSSRRDMALLGVIHRAVLKKGPEHFQRLFVVAPPLYVHLRRRHSRHITDPRTSDSLDIFKHSIFRLIAVYNLLPQRVVKLQTVKDFQTELQDILKLRARGGRSDWVHTFSPRIPLFCHPLLNI